SNCLKSEAIGLKPSPTSGLVSMEMQRGRALSKLKLRKVCPTGPFFQYDTKKSTEVRCEMRNSRSSYRTVKSSVLRYLKSRKPVMRTRSPSILHVFQGLDAEDKERAKLGRIQHTVFGTCVLIRNWK